MPWDYLFDSDYKQRGDIDQAASTAGAALDQAADTARRLQAAERRIDRLELMVHALVRLLEVRAGLSADELQLMIQRIDLADGFEDGRMGPDVSSEAPQCPTCGRPINPKRSNCLFCNTRLDPVARQSAEPITRHVECKSCGERVAESDTYFSEMGLLCAACFSG